MLRRFQSAPTTWWAWACTSLLVSGAGTLLLGEASWTHLVGFGLGTLYPALLVAGALRYSARDVPLWLPLAALAIGLGRGAAQIAGQPELAQGLALTFEVSFVLFAAVIVTGADTHGPRTPSQALLMPALVTIAVLEAATALAMFRGGTIPTPLVGAWLVSAPMLLALQLSAWGEIGRRELTRARELLEERVQEQTARYRVVSELSSDFAFAGRIARGGYVRTEWITDAVREITGYGAEDFQDLGWLNVIHPEDRARLEFDVRALFGSRDPDRDSVETRIVTKDGEVRWINVRLGTVLDEADGVYRVVGAVRDVTDRVRAEEGSRRLDLRMREMQRLESLGRLAGGIAHDFNNVLTVILGNVKLALGDGKDEEPVHRRRLERIRAAAEYASGLTEQILTYSGKAAVALEPLDLSRVVGELIDLLRASVSKKVRIESHLQEELPAVDGDVTQLRQLLLNLVVNASDAMTDHGGVVRIRTGARAVDEEELGEAVGGAGLSAGQYVTLRVGDDGIGMEPAVAARIFDPFFTTKAQGRGLGLAAVLGIVRAHRGAIRIDSRPLAGTVFEVLLPRSQRRSPKAVLSPVPVEPAPAAAGSRVLVIDDDEAVLELSAEFLSRAGFEVVTAGGGLEAIERVREQGEAIDAVVLDLVMPDLSGEETFLALRELHPELPVVLVSGFDREQAAHQFSARGVADFITKPFEPADLVEAVRRVLTLGS
jgi:PAS domain S-box-containing protein